MKNFDSLGLNPILVKSLAKMKYDIPTPIQAKAIPIALDGRDIMGSAQTGTGKTAAFAIPLVESLLSNPQGSALVMTPTRELGNQVLDVIHQLLGPNSEINTAFLIGGDSMQKQNNQLKRKPRLIVGTPGRINDHLERRSLKLGDTRFLVLDETDRMLDMGFSVQLDHIAKHLPRERQTLMFSATMPDNIMQMANKYLNNPERISVGSTIAPHTNIKQEVVRVGDGDKYVELVRQLDERMGSVIIFVKTKFGTERLAKRLKSNGHEANAIHGDLKQSRRSRVIADFRDMKFRILVATDVAARGLDVPHIEHVINHDLPQVPEDFIHRIGRTARAGAQGSALSFISPQDGRKWHAIEMLLDPTMKGASMPNKNATKKRGSGGKSFGKPSFGKSGGKPFGKPAFARSGEKPFGKPAFVKSSDRADDGKRYERANDEGSFDRDAGRNAKKKNPFQRGQKNAEQAERSFDAPQKKFNDRPERNDRNDRQERSDRNDRSDRPARSFDRADRPQRSNGSEGFKKPYAGGFKGKPSSDRNDRSDRPVRSYDRPERSDRADRPQRSNDSEGFKKPYAGGFKGKPRTEGGSSEGYQGKKSAPKSGGKPFGKPAFGKTNNGKPAANKGPFKGPKTAGGFKGKPATATGGKRFNADGGKPRKRVA